MLLASKTLAARSATAWFLLAAGLYATATAIRPEGPAIGLEPLRAVARPLALPFLWRSLRHAQHHEDPGALAARGQQLLTMLPMWTDGHILFAGELAMAASQRAGDADAALDRLLASFAMLEAATAARPTEAVRYLAAMASFAAIRGRQDPELSARALARLGADPSALADAYLARAEQLTPGAGVRDQRTFLLSSVIAGAIRTGDVARARETIATMLERLDRTDDRDLATRYAAALRRVDDFLAGSPSVALADLVRDPLLDEIAHALASRPVR